MKAIFVGGRYNGMEIDAAQVIELPEFSGQYTADLTEERARGSWVHRAELDLQPIVFGYVGPMWDGGKLRYETQEVYDMMSN